MRDERVKVSYKTEDYTMLARALSYDNSLVLSKRLVIALAAIVNIWPSTEKVHNYIGTDLTLEQAMKIQA